MDQNQTSFVGTINVELQTFQNASKQVLGFGFDRFPRITKIIGKRAFSQTVFCVTLIY